MSWVDCIGFCAAMAVLVSFCMTTIVPLRAFALVSNVLFVLYALLAHIYPVLMLHVVLLPVNLTKLCRMRFRKRSEPLKLEPIGTAPRSQVLRP
jgi:hypothetical protein